MIKQSLKKVLYNYKWKKLHPNCQMFPVNKFDFSKVTIGKWSYGELHVIDFGGNGRLIIGDLVSVAQNVTFVLNGEHNIHTISTYPLKTKMLKITNEESFSYGNIVIDDDVWIGYGATIMSGVHVGQGAIIAAGSVVTKDVAPYSIVGGVPAKIIKYRFNEPIIDILLKCNFRNLDFEFVKQNIDKFYNDVKDIDDIEWFINYIDKR